MIDAAARERLMAALMKGMPQAAPQPSAPPSKLALAMLARRRPGDAKYASLAALPPYTDPKHADSLNGTSPAALGAFQADAYQDDGYQVF